MAELRPEHDIRLSMLNTLLTCPHRDLESLYCVHADMVDRDARFYVRLAAWYRATGAVRDHQEMFAAMLIRSKEAGHREVGLALLRELPPYQVARVVDFLHGRVRRVRMAPGASGRREKARAAVRDAGSGEAAEEAPVEKRLERRGLFENLPRCLRTELRRYLQEREAKADWFDECAVTARQQLKRLYALTHMRPSARAQAILFDETPPPDSKPFRLKALARAESPVEQARAILEHRIPYRVAASVVRQMTPAVVVALIEVMTPQEVINNMASLQRRGALENPEVKELIERKLGQAQTDRRVSAYKAKVAAHASGVAPDVAARLDAVTEKQVQSRGRISRPTALLIDKSSSMTEAIEVAKHVGALLGAVCERELYVYAFDTIALQIEPGGMELASWEKALAGIKAAGCTSCGVAVDRLRQKKQYVEQIILITDEGENTEPRLTTALTKYRAELGADPAVCIIRTQGGSDQLERALQQAGMPCDAYQFNGDYYSLPNLVPLLARPSRLELLMEIAEYPLPKRKSA
jgi:hypothetical protein